MPLICGTKSNVLMSVRGGPNEDKLYGECCFDLTYVLSWDGVAIGNFVSPVTLTWDTHPTETDTNWYWSATGPGYFDNVQVTLYCYVDPGSSWRWHIESFSEGFEIVDAKKIGAIPVGTYTNYSPDWSNFQIA